MIPIAAFLAGSLLTLLLPTGMLIALAIWYTVTVRRAPEAADLPQDEPVLESPLVDSGSGTPRGQD